MNTIIIGIAVIIVAAIICYTIYKIKSLNTFIKVIKDDVDYILNTHDTYVRLTKNKDNDAWKYSVSENEYLRVLNMIRKYYNN
jgi:hypothetical protein